MHRLERPHGAVGKTVHDFQPELTTIEQPKHPSATLGAQIKRQDFLFLCHSSLVIGHLRGLVKRRDNR